MTRWVTANQDYTKQQSRPQLYQLRVPTNQAKTHCWLCLFILSLALPTLPLAAALWLALLNGKELSTWHTRTIEGLHGHSERLLVNEIHEAEAFARPILQAHDLDALARDSAKRRKHVVEVQIRGVGWQARDKNRVLIVGPFATWQSARLGKTLHEVISSEARQGYAIFAAIFAGSLGETALGEATLSTPVGLAAPGATLGASRRIGVSDGHGIVHALGDVAVQVVHEPSSLIRGPVRHEGGMLALTWDEICGAQRAVSPEHVLDPLLVEIGGQARDEEPLRRRSCHRCRLKFSSSKGKD